MELSFGNRHGPGGVRRDLLRDLFWVQYLPQCCCCIPILLNTGIYIRLYRESLHRAGAFGSLLLLY